MSSEGKHNVFVYGTLKRGCPNNHVMNNTENGCATFIAEGVTEEKFRLVIASSAGIPMMLNKPGNGKNIQGEIFEVDEQMRIFLDRFESVGVFYDVIEIAVANKVSGDVIPCLCYVINNFKEELLNYPAVENYEEEQIKLYVPKHQRPNMPAVNFLSDVKYIS